MRLIRLWAAGDRHRRRAASTVISLKRGHLCETDLKFRSWRCVLNIARLYDFAYTYLIYRTQILARRALFRATRPPITCPHLKKTKIIQERRY